MVTVEDYDLWKKREREQSAAQTGFVLNDARNTNPDEYAEDIQLGRAFGVPADVAAAGRVPLQERLNVLRAKTILGDSPRTAEWLRQTDNARLAHDDIEGLSWFERAGQSFKMGEAQAVKQGQEFTRDIGGVLERSPLGRGLSAAGEVFDNTFLTNDDGTPNLFGQLANFAREASNVGSINAPVQKVGDERMTSEQRASAMFNQQLGAIYEGSKSLLAQMDKQGFKPASYKDVSGVGSAFSFIAENLAMSLPQMATAISTGGFSPLIQIIGQGAEANNELSEKAPDLTPEQRVSIAAGAGAVNAALDMVGLAHIFGGSKVSQIATDAIAGTLVGKIVANGGSKALGQVLSAAIVEGTTESIQEAVVMGATSLAGGKYGSPEVIDRLLQSFFAGAGAGGGIRGGLEVSGAARRLLRESNQASAAEQTKATIDQIGDASVDSKLRERLDSSFMDFVGKAVDGTPIQDVYVPADKLQELFQSHRYDPQEFLDGLPGVDTSEWATALATGGDIKIPTATYAAKIAGMNIDAPLRENMRFSPEGMTWTEAQDFNSRASEIQMEAFEQSEAARVAEEQARSVDQQEYDELVSRLRAAGRSTDVARFEAMPLIAMRRTMAERAGISQEEFAARNPLPQVRGEVPEGMKTKNVDELSRQLAELRSYVAKPKDLGPSLLEAISDYGGINDVGGELKSRDAAVIKRGKGKKTLRLARQGVVNGVKDLFGSSEGKKHGIDDVAQAMIDAGYLQDNPTVIEFRHALETGTEVPDIGRALLEGIDEELRGNVHHSGAREIDPKETWADDTVAYLDTLGVSLNDSDDVIREAISKAQAEEGRKYAQPSLRQKLQKLTAALADLAEFARTGPKNETKTVVVAQVSDAVADIVQAATGADIHGFQHSVDAFAIRHMINRHGDADVETGRGQVALTDEDFKLIPELLASATHVVTGGKSPRGQDIIGYIATAPDGEVFYLEEVRTGRKKLAALSMRKFPPATESNSIAESLSLDVQNVPEGGATVTEIPAGSKMLFQPGRRGSIQLPFGGASDSAVIISLFESADLSTFLHETGHYFLNTLEDMASPPGISPEIVDMHLSVKNWWAENAEAVAKDAKEVSGIEVTADDVRGFLDGTLVADANLNSAIVAGQHEQFARAFEAYLMEGKSPSIELRSVFERFAQWMMRLYRNMLGLNVNVSADMRSVFDRMIATDGEIQAAREDVSDEMLFAAAEAAGVSPDDYRELVRLHDQSIEAANQRLRKEVMAPIQRETEKWYKTEKAKVREEVTDDINRQPVYRAWEWLGNRRWLSGEAPEGMPDMRLDRQSLIDRYGEGVLKTLPRGQFHLYANEGGMDPDEVAGWFGFTSGDTLVKALENAPARKEAIEAETERVMRERHGDVLRDGQIEERAIEAVHNDKRGQFLAAELKILKAKAGDTSPEMTVAQAREAARQTISRMQVRDAVASNRFLTAERKAANEAVKLARLVERENLWSRQQRRDVQSAARSGSLRATNSATDRANASTDRYNDAVAMLVEQKRRQLLNHMLYSESQKAAEEVEKAERYVSRLSKPSTRSNLAGDYLEAIDELLERYDFRKLSARAEQRRGALLSYVARMTAERRDNELNIPDDVIEDARRRPYKQLRVEELRGVIDTLKNIEHTARLKQKLKDAKRERDLEAVVDDILAEFDANVKGQAPSRARSGRGGAQQGFRSYLNLVKTADTILREIDGFADGAAYRHIKAPIDDAMNDLTVKRREAGEKFEELYSVYSSAERRAMTTLMEIPELNGQFSKWDLISIALNVGNNDNYQRLTDNRVKGFFTPQQVELALLRLDQRDWNFVQSAWDMIESYWPEIAAREKRVSGIAPEKVQPREVQTRFGKFKGGYFPLKYDAEISSLARDDDLNEIAKSMTGGRYGKAQTRNGHLKERSQSSGRPVLIDIAVMHGHVNQVIHDLALSEVTANAWRVLQNNDVKSAFLDRGLKSDFEALEVWLQDVASGEVRSSDFMSKWSRKMKSGFTVSKLAFNLATVLMQPTGLAQAAVVVGKKNLVLGLQDVFRRPLRGPESAASEIIARSPFMQERETTFNKDVYDMLGEVKTGPAQSRVSQFTNEILAPWGFWLMQKAQFYTVDMPTWLAGYRQALDQGKSEADAISHADRIVARAAASGQFSDRTAIERGTLSSGIRQNDVVRLFTTLGSYMFAKFNVAYEKTRQTQFKDPRQVLTWTTDMVMLFTVEAVLTAAIRGQLPGGDDEDKDGWMAFLAKQTGMSIASTLPFIRDMSSAVQGYGGGGAYGSIMETLARPLFQASQGEVDKAFVRSVVDAGGLFLHLPSAQTNRLVDATWRQAEEDQSPFEFIQGATVGRPK
jgi:hypothetical protein